MGKFIKKNKEVILYLLFGVFTTLVNVVVFWLCRRINLNIYLSNGFAWIFAVFFAYVTNKLWVFETGNESQSIFKEIILFFGARVFSLFVDMGTIGLLIDILHVNDMVSKIISNILVVIINYFFSKFIIFRKKEIK